MGCWYKTCGLSNLHITASQPVYVFVLLKQLRSDFCYTNCFWDPVLLPFDSEYNEYGSGENSSGAALPLIMNGIKTALVEQPQGENPYHDIAVTCSDFDQELFWNAVRENRLFVRSYEREPRAVNFVMFRKDIMDSILNNHMIMSYVGADKGTCGHNRSYVTYGYSDIIAAIPEYVHMVKQNCTNDLLYMSFSWNLPKTDNLAAQWIRTDRFHHSLLNLTEIFADHMKQGKQTELEELLALYLKGLYVDRFMSATRRVWIPGAHEGSQNNDPDAHQLLCKTIMDALDREQQLWDS